MVNPFFLNNFARINIQFIIMKKNLALALILLIGLSSSLFADKKVAVYGVGFYNLENLFDTINNNGKYDLEYSPKGAKQWNHQKYQSKLKNMAYAISEMGDGKLDILGVSEIENITVLQDLVKTGELAERGLKIVHYDSPDRRGIDVGMLYNPKTFRVLATQSRELRFENEPTYFTRDQLVVTGLLGGEKVSVIVNHWPSRWGGAEQSSPHREAAAALTRSIVDSLQQNDPMAKVIIMGDMNDDPRDKSCAVVLDAKKDLKEVAEGGLYNPMWKIHERGIGTLAYKGQWNLFDQIIITKSLTGKERSSLKFWKAEVFNKSFLLNKEGLSKGYPKRTHASGVFTNGYSDHLPVLIYLVKEHK